MTTETTTPRARRRRLARKFIPDNKWVRLDDCDQDTLGRQHQDRRDRQAAAEQIEECENE